MINVQEKVSLSPLTSFRIGGEASFYVEIKNVEELKEALGFAKEKQLDFYVLGGGTNMLVSDEGFKGLVIRMKMNEINFKDNVLEADAGAPLIKMINTAAKEGLSGIESLAGIPGTVGGAVRGNAGAFGCEICSAVKSVKYFDVLKMAEETVEGSFCEFTYRSSIFKQDKNKVVLSVKVNLAKADSEEVKKKTQETIMGRASKGLHGVKSAGSYFMNPKVENENILEEFKKEKGVAARNNVLPAGWVIDRVNLRGKTIGGARISEQHANYVINTGSATAEDVMMLVSYVKQQVRDQLGIQLQEEVNYVGF